MASIFSRIVAGEIPCYKVAETDNCLAFLDVNPVVKGHVLCIGGRLHLRPRRGPLLRPSALCSPCGPRPQKGLPLRQSGCRRAGSRSAPRPHPFGTHADRSRPQLPSSCQDGAGRNASPGAEDCQLHRITPLATNNGGCPNRHPPFAFSPCLATQPVWFRSSSTRYRSVL